MLGRILLLLVIQLAKQGLIHARPSHDPGQTGQCPSTGLPAGGLRYLNVIHQGKPRYRLDLEHTRTGYVPGHTYTIYVRAQDPSQTFGDVLLSVSSESRTCEHGNFSVYSENYYQPDGCDHIVLKNTRGFDHTFTFQWTAPTCGCVNLRARVKSADNVYYLDNENVIDGYLTKRVCRRHMSTIISKISHSEREKLLCQVVSSSDDQVIDEGHYLQRRKMDLSLMTVLERDALHVSFHQRIYLVQQCCELTGTAQTDCLGDIRRHRIDELCANTQHTPFSVRSNAYMTERRDNCCWRLGERRYDCFAMGHRVEGVLPQSDVDRDVAMVTGVNVLDESDPVNDLEDYPNRLSEELVRLQTLHEELDRENKHVADQNDVQHNDYISTKASKFPKEPENIPVREEVAPLQSPPKDLVQIAPTPQTQPLTQTTAGLEKKLLRAQVELECCQQGKEYGKSLVTGNTWNRCEQRTRKVIKAMRGKSRRWCRRYHMRCCVESVHSAQLSDGDHNQERDTTGNPRVRDTTGDQRVKVRDTTGDQSVKVTDTTGDPRVTVADKGINDSTQDTSTEVTMVTGVEEENNNVNDNENNNDSSDEDADDASNDNHNDNYDDDDITDNHRGNDDDNNGADDDDDNDNYDDDDITDNHQGNDDDNNGADDDDDDDNDVNMDDSEETGNAKNKGVYDSETIDDEGSEHEATTQGGQRSGSDEMISSVISSTDQDDSLSREQQSRPNRQRSGSTSQNLGSTDQLISELPKPGEFRDRQLQQTSNHNSNTQPIETVKPSRGQQSSSEETVRRKKQRKRKGRRSGKKGRRNRRQGGKHMTN